MKTVRQRTFLLVIAIICIFPRIGLSQSSQKYFNSLYHFWGSDFATDLIVNSNSEFLILGRGRDIFSTTDYLSRLTPFTINERGEVLDSAIFRCPDCIYETAWRNGIYANKQNGYTIGGYFLDSAFTKSDYFLFHLDEDLDSVKLVRFENPGNEIITGQNPVRMVVLCYGGFINILPIPL